MKRLKKFNEGWRNEPEPEEYYIVREYLDILRDGKELNQEQKEFINEYFKYPNLYDITSKWLQNSFDTFSKYNIEEIEDRLVEFFDQLPDWDPYLMFSLHMEYAGGEGWLGISSDKLDDPKYLLIELSNVFSDLLFHTKTKKYSKSEFTIDYYLENKRPVISIHFNRTNESRKSYNLLFLEDLGDKIVKRLSQLYKIVDVKWDNNRYTGRLYNPDTDVNDYTLTLIIE
jgi:hypothetical protein